MKGKGKGELTERSLNMVARAGSIKEFQTGASQLNHVRNKAGYTAQDASENNAERTDLRTYGRTDTPSYRDARTHLIMVGVGF